MRTTKRFTPKVLLRFEREGRGRGTFDDFAPWHQVTRGDPASQGRSHLLYWHGRLRHLLSDLEWGAQLFALMLPSIVDSTEQARLSLDDDVHTLTAYTLRAPQGLFAGTRQLAAELGIKHPRTHDKGESTDWVSTTDVVLTLNDGQGELNMLAVAVKPKDWSSRRRTVELLRLEREYWARRKVPWLLITPEVWSKEVVLTLRRISSWAIAEPVAPHMIRMATECAMASPWSSVTHLIETLERHTSSRHAAQCAMWQAVWTGALPIDLRRGWRPQEPLRLLSKDAFWAQNPVASRRSAWI